MTDGIQLKNTNLSAGYIACQGAYITFGYKKRIANNPTDGEADTTQSRFTIAKADRVGVENPTFTVHGVISLFDYTTNDTLWKRDPSTNVQTNEEGGSMTSVVTPGFLLGLCGDITAQTYLKVSIGNPSSQLNWVAWPFSNPLIATDTEIPVEIITCDFIPAQNSEGLHFIEYTIELREVRFP